MTNRPSDGAFRMKRRVQFAETDLAGVMHFANYYRIMEEVEHAFWRSLGMCVVMECEGREVTFPRVSTSCQYFSPARFEDELDLTFSLAEIGRCSITCEVEFAIGARRVAAGRAKAACCTMLDGAFKSITIPPPIREKLAKVAKVNRGV